jgi:tryptophanyl-tRNA synthetase
MKVAEAVISKLEPIQKRYKEILDNPKYLREIYEKGAKNAKEIASKTLREVKNKVGVI